MEHSHENAFGVNLPKNKLEEIIKKCNELLPVESLTTCYQCDWEIPAADLKREYVQEVAENYEVFGSTVPSPSFAIKDLEINASDITGYGENNNFIRFVYNGIVFVKKYCNHDDFDNMTLKGRSVLGVNKKNLKLNIIGQFVLSAWEDKVAPEVRIIDFDSEEIKGEIAKPNVTNTTDEWDFETAPAKTKVEDDAFDW